MMAYEKNPQDRLFSEDLWIHLESGHVISTDKVFVMARPVHTLFTAQQMRCPWISSSIPNAWFVWMLCGEWSEALRLMPFFLPHIIFARKGVVKCYTTERLMRYGRRNRKSTAAAKTAHTGIGGSKFNPDAGIGTPASGTGLFEHLLDGWHWPAGQRS